MVSILINAADTQRLKQIIGDLAPPLKHVLRAKIELMSGDRLPVLELERCTNASRPAVRHWQRRFAKEGAVALLHFKTRKPRTPPIAKAVMARVVALTFTERPAAVFEPEGPCLKPSAFCAHLSATFPALMISNSDICNFKNKF